MNSTGRLLISLILLTLSAGIFAQENCEIPEPPELRRVTVDAERSAVILDWDLSISENIDAYIIYLYEERNGNIEFYPIDTVWNPTATSYTDTRIQYKSFQYRVASFRRPHCGSRLSNILSTVYVESVLDTCRREIEIIWNAYYPPFPANVLEYKILTSLNGGVFSEMHTAGPETTSFKIKDITPATEYCFRINAIMDDETESSSTITCKRAELEIPPGWINADYATVTTDGAILLSFTIDQGSASDLFALERRSGLSGNFQQIAQIRTKAGFVTYNDNTADQKKLYSYRLSALNSCGVSFARSNIASNILLSAQNNGNEITLRWNKYREWAGTVSSYRIYMDSGSGFTEKAVLDASDTTFSIGTEEIMFAQSAGSLCFYVGASETGNPYGINGVSESNISCVEMEENFVIPNIFTPDGDMKNDLFRPVITFAPTAYRLVISNRQGKAIFETDEYMESWDGTDNGRPVNEGVYIWFIRMTTPSGTSISRTGTVTVVKN